MAAMSPDVRHMFAVAEQKPPQGVGVDELGPMEGEHPTPQFCTSARDVAFSAAIAAAQRAMVGP